MVFQSAAESLFPNKGIAVTDQEPYPPMGDNHRVKTVDFSFKSSPVIRGGYVFVLCWYNHVEDGEPEPVPWILGHLQLDGPTGDQFFTQASGKQLVVQPV